MGSSAVLSPSVSGSAVFDTTLTRDQLIDVSEYGYGFWLRFMTRYPTQMFHGRTASFYFVSRLTENNPFGNTAVGDRTLAIWQGASAYYFTTYDQTSGNTNIVRPVATDDTEAQWSFIYYSFSSLHNSAVGFY